MWVSSNLSQTCPRSFECCQPNLGKIGWNNSVMSAAVWVQPTEGIRLRPIRRSDAVQWLCSVRPTKPIRLHPSRFNSLVMFATDRKLVDCIGSIFVDMLCVHLPHMIVLQYWKVLKCIDSWWRCPCCLCGCVQSDSWWRCPCCLAGKLIIQRHLLCWKDVLLVETCSRDTSLLICHH